MLFSSIKVSRLTFVSRHEVLYIFGNVLVEMQLADVEGLDYRAVVQHQQPRVTTHLEQDHHELI